MKIKTLLLFSALLALPALSQEANAQDTTSDSEYQLVFSDEFDTPDGSMPDDSKWVRCVRYSSTWNRWLAITYD